MKKIRSNTQLEGMSLPPSTASSSTSAATTTITTSATTTTTTTSAKRKYEERAFQPDFLTYAWLFGNRFDLFVVEVKPPKSTMAAYDLLKMTKEMKFMLGRLVNLGVEAPSVCGLWVDGKLYIYINSRL